jgi:hypothetical protein
MQPDMMRPLTATWIQMAEKLSAIKDRESLRDL